MLLLMFFLPALVNCNNCSRLQHKTPRKRPTYTFDLNAETQDIQHYDVLITDISIGVLNKFWKSTGLCPPDPHQESFKFFLSKDMKQNLFHIGSLPFDGIAQVRIHWLLDLVRMSVKTSCDVTYNFTFLDDLIHEHWKNNLHLGFELMGNPSNFFTDFENSTQVYMWRDLVAVTASRYINFYGIDYVMKWNFESWNEPDHHDFDKLNFTVQGFLNYYDACSEGLKLADKRLKFGGPGGSCRLPTVGHSPLCWALLQHCFGGKNFFTGKIGSRMDFISFHKKGNASSLLIVEQERQTIDYMRRKFKIPNSIPFYNDEADPLKNWALPQLWRADATYAAMAVKILLSHIDEYYMKNETRDIRFGLLSNDNAFLSYFPYQFTERTLLARFQVNNTQPKYVEFVKKPIYAIFGLLSQLCPSIIHTKVYKQGKSVRSVGDFGIVATHCADRNQVVIVMYNSADSTLSNVTYDIDLYLNVTSFNSKNARWLTAEINNIETNPYLIWQKLGKPFYPTAEEFSSMKDYEGPHINGPWSITSSPYKLHLKILNPGVTMVNICKTHFPLKKVNNIRFLPIRNNSVQISWTDTDNRCVLTYNVEYSTYAHGPYKQLNQKRVVYPTYWHSCRDDDVLCSVKGFYRVCAVDYWNIDGPFSIVAEFKGILN